VATVPEMPDGFQPDAVHFEEDRSKRPPTKAAFFSK
jgi:hypothetical protein